MIWFLCYKYMLETQICEFEVFSNPPPKKYVNVFALTQKRTKVDENVYYVIPL